MSRGGRPRAGAPGAHRRAQRRGRPSRARSGAGSAGRRRPRRGRAGTPRPRLFALAAGGALLLLLALALPAARTAVAAARETLYQAVAAGRAADARRLQLARWALRHSISLELARSIEQAAVREGIDPDLAFRLVRVESGFRQFAVSPAGALGYTQLMPATAASLQPGIAREQILERDTNLRLGFRYLRWLLELYDGRIDEALHAYNRGPGTVGRIRARGGDPANGYADRVLGRGGPGTYQGDGLLPTSRLPPFPSGL